VLLNIFLFTNILQLKFDLVKSMVNKLHTLLLRNQLVLIIHTSNSFTVTFLWLICNIQLSLLLLILSNLFMFNMYHTLL